MGVKFWSGPKRPPTAAEFDAANPLHFAFVEHAAALNAAVYGVALPPRFSSPDVLGPAMRGVALPPFVPKAVRIKADDKDTTQVRGCEGLQTRRRRPLPRPCIASSDAAAICRRARTTTASSSPPTPPS